MRNRYVHLVGAVVLVQVLWLPQALAQQPKAGVVTTLQGQAVVARPVIPQPIPLKFKDDVFLQDRIDTRENSIARVLLGGKALVTIRELSTFTVTEEPGRAVVDIRTGKLALSVAKQLLRPGESIEVRTPHAIAAVRGTRALFIVTDKATEVRVLEGVLELFARLAPAVGTPLKANELVNVSDKVGAVGQMTPEQRAATVSDAQGPKPKEQSDKPAGGEKISAEKMSEATQLAGELTPEAAAPPTPLPPVWPSPPTPPPVYNPGEGQDGLEEKKKDSNLGFELGNLTNWTLNGAGKVISSFGTSTLEPPEGKFMFLGHTGTGAFTTGLSCASTTDACQRTTLSRDFTVSSVVSVTFKYVLLTREINCTGTSCSDLTDTGASTRNDRWQVRLIPATGSAVTLFDTTVSAERTAGTFRAFGQTFGIDTNGDGVDDFSLRSTSGETFSSGGDFTTVTKTGVVSAGTVTLEFSVTDVGDTAFDSGALLDGVVFSQDPPLFFLKDGSTFTRTDPAPFFQFTNSPQTFDSLLMVCCDSSATLAGPALKATNSDLTVPFSLVGVLQGGTLTTSSTDPLVLLEGGTHSLGSLVGVFDIAGVNTATDPNTGLTLGTDRPLRHAGAFLDASGATVTTQTVLKLDTALLEATRPLLNLKAGSNLTTQSAAVDLSYKAKVTSLGSLVKLDGSTLDVKGPLINVNRSVLSGSGSLLSLSGGATLNAQMLASVQGGGLFNWAGALSTFSGAGNTINFNNSLCAANSCATIGGLKFALQSGALSSNVTVTNPTPWVGLGTNGTVSLPSNGAHFLVTGSSSQVKITP